MSRIVVADAGPLIGLARIARISLLTTLYGPVIVPETVLEELRVDSDRPGARVLADALAKGFIEARALPKHRTTDLDRLSLVLDAGEAAAIVLAQALSCRFLLIDERRGRAIARRHGVPVVGLAGVLLAAKRHGLIEKVEPVLSALSESGYRLSDSLVAEVLRLADEARQDQTSRRC
jgi:predicted nucleic acid-binding protein